MGRMMGMGTMFEVLAPETPKPLAASFMGRGVGVRGFDSCAVSIAIALARPPLTPDPSPHEEWGEGGETHV